MGKRIAVIGGGLVGIEVASFLAERGRTVTVFEESGTLATEMALPRRWRELNMAREFGVRMLVNAKIESINEKDITYSAKEGGQDKEPVDSVIIAAGVKNNMALFEKIRDLGFKVYAIGDCSSVEYITGAILGGSTVGREV